MKSVKKKKGSDVDLYVRNFVSNQKALFWPVASQLNGALIVAVNMIVSKLDMFRV